ncbi:ATP-binding protein [Dyella jejuensis]
MVIGGSLDMLDVRAERDARTSRLLAAARHGVERGAKLTQQLLAFSRRQDLRAEAICIDDLIGTFRSLLDRAIGETVELTIEPAAQRWFCRTDPHQLETAILNLAINACDAMPRGGHLRIITVLEALDEQTASAYDAKAGEYVTVAVADTGVGMTPELIARVFEPFFTTKEVGKGTGLGLSQVYGFARQSGGFVSIQSEPGRGTTVSIHLPRTHEAPAVATDTRPHMDTRGKGVVLVVEDDDDVRTVTCGLLQDLGYSVLEADSGRRALDIVESGKHIDLVFSDVVMSGDMNGIDLARALTSRHVGTPILLTSGYTALRLVSDATLEGLQFLRKPFNQNELSIAVGAMLKAARA